MQGNTHIYIIIFHNLFFIYIIINAIVKCIIWKEDFPGEKWRVSTRYEFAYNKSSIHNFATERIEDLKLAYDYEIECFISEDVTKSNWNNVSPFQLVTDISTSEYLHIVVKRVYLNNDDNSCCIC